jgi:hypothetical protein
MTAEQPTELSCEAEASILIVAQAESAQGEKPSGEIEERAVPRMGPGGMTPGKTPGKIEGATFESNQLRAQPGYVLQQQADGSVMLRRANGAGGGTFSCYCASGKGGSLLLRPATGGNGFDLSCRCAGGKGRCDLLFDEGSARCYSPKGGCSGSCEMRGSFVTGSSGLRMQ